MAVRQVYLDLLKLRREVAGRRMGATIARHFGISNNTVNRWLSGQHKLTLERFNTICKLIDVHADEYIQIKIAA